MFKAKRLFNQKTFENSKEDSEGKLSTLPEYIVDSLHTL